MKDKKEPSVWIVALKLFALAIFIIGSVGFALWYAGQNQRLDNPNTPAQSPADAWGIANDSPISPKR